MTTEERDEAINALTDYQKTVILKKVHEALYREEGELNPNKEWDPDTIAEVAAEFSGTELVLSDAL